MAHARNTDPITSHEAAASVNDITKTQEFILKALVRPRTDIDLVEAYRNLKLAPRASESGIRSRRAELVRAGLIMDTGERVKLASGRNAIVWAKA
jgi:hypothetical protein